MGDRYTNDYGYYPTPKTNRGCYPDIQLALKQEIMSQGYSPSAGGGKPSYNPPVAAGVCGFQDTELYFDSTQSDSSSNYSSGAITWYVATLNNLNDISNCVEMHLDEFYFPKIYAPTGKPEYFYFRRVFIEFTATPTGQEVLGPGGNNFHWECEVDNLPGQAVLLRPIKKSFFFKQPIQSITKWTMAFSTPPTTYLPAVFPRIPIPVDHVRVQIVTVPADGDIGTNPVQLRIIDGNTTSVFQPIGAVTPPGIAVFISNWVATGNPAFDGIASPYGVFVTNIVDNYIFELGAFNFTSFVSATPVTATVYIPKNRIAVPVRFTSVLPQVTNSVTVIHS